MDEYSTHEFEHFEVWGFCLSCSEDRNRMMSTRTIRVPYILCLGQDTNVVQVELINKVSNVVPQNRKNRFPNDNNHDCWVCVQKDVEKKSGSRTLRHRRYHFFQIGKVFCYILYVCSADSEGHCRYGRGIIT